VRPLSPLWYIYPSALVLPDTRQNQSSVDDDMLSPTGYPSPHTHSSRHGPQPTQHTASTAATPRYPQGRTQTPSPHCMFVSAAGRTGTFPLTKISAYQNTPTATPLWYSPPLLHPSPWYYPPLYSAGLLAGLGPSVRKGLLPQSVPALAHALPLPQLGRLDRDRRRFPRASHRASRFYTWAGRPAGTHI